MLTYPNIDPVAVHLGPLSIHWYALSYLVGFFLSWVALTFRTRDLSYGFTRQQLADIVFYVALGVIIGGRLGYMLFYDWVDLSQHPLRIFMVWHGGMSFHGGLIGVTFSLWLYGRQINKSLGEVTDFVLPALPLGLCIGRIGNFINGELWGRVTDVPWAMIFPNGGPLPRHPSQLYEAILEGLVLFSILWIYSRKPRPTYAVSGMFLMFYGLFRFMIEFIREPDAQIGYLAWGWLTEGQLLSVPLIMGGMAMMVWAYRRNQLCCST